MDIVKYILLGFGVCIFLLTLFLFLPVRYRVEGTMKGMSVTLRFLGGLGSKTFSFMKEKEESSKDERMSEEKGKEYDHALTQDVDIEEDRIEDVESLGEPVEPEGEDAVKKMPDTTLEAKKKQPSIVAQLHFAYKNGALQKVLDAIAALLRHSTPYRWDIGGRFGTGDSMLTGCIVGAIWATIPEFANHIEWDYIENRRELQGTAYGRIIPAYALWIVICTVLTKPVRELWKFRKGGTT